MSRSKRPTKTTICRDHRIAGYDKTNKIMQISQENVQMYADRLQSLTQNAYPLLSKLTEILVNWFQNKMTDTFSMA